MPSALRSRPVREELHLNRAEQSRLLGLIQALITVDRADEFEAWTTGPLQDLLPHGMMICGLAEILPQNILIQKVITHDWPLAYFDALKKPEGGFYSPIMARWNVHHAPQLYEPECDRGITHKLWLDVFHDFRLRNIAAHGVRAPSWRPAERCGAWARICKPGVVRLRLLRRARWRAD
ncbi:MAG: hypothetical protein ACR2GP_15000 [Burkholderiaceae bacterium]